MVFCDHKHRVCIFLTLTVVPLSCACVILCGANSVFGQDKLSKLTEYESDPNTFASQPVEVTALSLSPNEAMIVTGDCDGKVRLYDRESRTLKHMIAGHSDVVSAIAFSPDGNRLATAGFDGKVQILSVPDLSIVKSIGEHKVAVTDVVFSPNDTTIATCGYDKTIHLFNTDTGHETATLSEHQATVRCLAYSPDGTLFVSGGDDKTVRVWDAKTGKLVRTIEYFNARVRDVAFSFTGQYIAGIDEDGMTLVFSMTDPDYTRKLNRSGRPGWRLAFAEHDAIITGYRGGEMRIWDLENENRRPNLQFSGHTDSFTGLAYVKSDRSIISTSYDRDVLICVARLPAKLPIARVRTGNRVWDSAMTPQGNLLATAGRGGLVEIRNLKTGELIRKLDSHRSTADRVRFSADGSLVATAGWKSTEIVVRRVANGQNVQTLDAEANVRSVAYSPDGTAIAAACENGHLIVFQLPSGKRLCDIAAHTMKVQDVAWSPDGNTILTCEGDWEKNSPGAIKVWDAKTFTEATQLMGHSTGIASIVCHPDGNRAATAARSGRIKIWDLKSYRQLANLGPNDKTLPKSTTRIRSIEYSPNGKFIAAAMYDGTANLWDVESQRLIRRFRGDDDMFTVRFSPDGSVLCGAAGKWDVLFWDISDLNPGPTAGWIQEWGPKSEKKKESAE